MKLIVETDLYIEKKSKFLGVIIECNSIDQIKSSIKELQKNKKYTKATHYIYAYKIDNNIGKNDDGEKGAGMILMEQIQKHNELENILMVVMRWYGGIHLGSKRFRIINSIAQDLIKKYIEKK